MISPSQTTDKGSNLIQDEKGGVDLKRIFYRALPYWPLLPIIAALFLTVAYFYLKYQVPLYKVSTRVVVNDGEQEKGFNFLQAIRPYNTDKETERETEILQSKSLISEVVREHQFNVQWTKIGRVAKLPQFGNLPLEVWLQNPDSVKSTTTAMVSLISGNIVEFEGVKYPIDSLVQSRFGKIRWHLHDSIFSTNEWSLTISTVKSAAGTFKGQLSAAPINKQSAIIDLNLMETIPARGEIFLNALLEQYGKNSVAFKNRVYQNTANFLEERLRLVVDELSGVESQLQNFKSKEGIFNLSAQGEMFLSQLKETDQKAGETELQLDVLRKIEQYVNNRNRNPESVPATLGLSDPILLSLLNQLYEAEFEAEKLRKLSGDKNPQLQVLDESLLKLRPSILASIRNLRISLQSSKEKLDTENNLLLGQLKKIPQKERALLEISRQQQIKNNIYTYLLQKREESLTAAAAQVSSHRVINAPEFAGKVLPKPTMVYSFAFSMALALVIVFVYLKEFINNKVLFSDDLTQATGLPLLGEMVYSRRAEEDAIIQPSERILIAEQLRDLRTNLSYIQVAKEGAQVLLITSSISGEGKSFLAVNLAAALARVDKKVLVMECDLRKPAVCKKLGVSPGKGLTDYLIGAAGFEEILRPVEKIQNISLISSGPIPPNPVELLMNRKFSPLMEKLKTQFHYIVIDAPPVAILTDAKVLAMEADSTLYVVRYNYTPSDFLVFIKEQATRKTLPGINLIFNGINSNKLSGKGYGYGYGYAYGYGYIKEDAPVKGKSIFNIFKRRTR